MLSVRRMRTLDKIEVLEMVKSFYSSEAVDHKVEDFILERTFMDAAGQDPCIWGVLIYDEDVVVGFAYMTVCYACEVGGRTLILEELYMKEESRGKGYGKQFFTWMFKEYPDILRFRLEVTKSNEGAIALYERLGFQYLQYGQMVHDR